MKTGLVLAISLFAAIDVSETNAIDFSDKAPSRGGGFVNNRVNTNYFDKALRIAQTKECQSCNAELKRQVDVCNTFYPPASQVAAHRDCLAKARSTFDSCRAASC